jgi:hypothetical protein
MNTASILFFICYIPEYYANYINKNANLYNVFEKILILSATTFALSYSIKNNNQALIINYGPLFALDIIALYMRGYYAFKNRNRDVRLKINKNDLEYDIENPMQYIEKNIDVEL